MVAGPELADFFGAHLGFPSVFTWAWKILQWPSIWIGLAAARDWLRRHPGEAPPKAIGPSTAVPAH